jgi:hypothetical protein
MKTELKNKLKLYSALTSGFTTLAVTSFAETIVTPVNYVGGYASYDIDINDDGVIDFNMFGFGSTTTYSGFDVKFGGVVLTGLSSNRVGAYSQNISVFGFSYPLNVLSAFSNGKVAINSGLPFLSNGVLAGTYSVSVSGLKVAGSDFGNFSRNDKYSGVEFFIDGNIHYGWLRFKNVKKDGSAWTLVEMAYNDNPGEEILSINQLLNKSTSLSIVSDANKINIMTDASLMNAKVDVVNMLGQTVANTVITSNTTSINNTFGSGIFIVRISDDKGKAITRKIKI